MSGRPRRLARRDSCPYTPRKRRFATREAAERSATTRAGADELFTYACACGWWHVTSWRPQTYPSHLTHPDENASTREDAS